MIPLTPIKGHDRVTQLKYLHAASHVQRGWKRDIVQDVFLLPFGGLVSRCSGGLVCCWVSKVVSRWFGAFVDWWVGGLMD
jgi:hypothetical protein